MEKVYEMTHKEKELLTVLGRFPAMPLKELRTRIQYKWTSTIVRKIEQLREQKILFGPSYYLDPGKLCKNLLYRVFCIMETHQKLETVISYLEMIKSFGWVFPVLSPRKNMLIAGFYSSDNAEMRSLFQLLKESNVITDYAIRISQHKRIMENPNLFGNPNPPLDTILEPTEVPDWSYGEHSTEWNECDMSILLYLITGHPTIKLVEILRRERASHRKWTYSQVSYSFEKMVKAGLIRKECAVSPFPYNQCVYFALFLKCDTSALTPRLIYNFGKGERIYREILLLGEWGLVECVSHPVFLSTLLQKLDQIDVIKEKELYSVRSLPPGKCWFSSVPDLSDYDFESQTLQFPYYLYREKVKQKLENESMLE
ncbi:MAG: hypothetical protein WBA22_06115 [Candidatus Methanofastidiosia archaeon]